MKQSFRLIFVSLILLTGIFVLNSCSEQKSGDELNNLPVYNGDNIDENAVRTAIFAPDNAELKTTEEPEICGDLRFFPLIAGQNTFVGSLVVFNDIENLYVIYYSEGLDLTDFHLYVGPKEDLPLNSPGNPKIGHFPYKAESGNNGIKTFIIPLYKVPKCYVIAAHAVLGEETVWAFSETSFDGSRWGWLIEDCLKKCDRPDTKLLTAKLWLRNSKTFEQLAASVQTDVTERDACYVISLVPAGDGVVYNLYDMYNPGPALGTMTSTVTNDKLVVTLTAGTNIKIRKSVLFLGTIEQYDSNYLTTGCQNWEAWPYKLITYSGLAQHVYEIPLK